MGGEKPIWEPLKWPLRAAVVLVGHIGLALLLVSAIWLVEYYLKVLYGDKGHLLFGIVPLNWLFDFMDVSILVLFIGWGLVEANQKLRGR